MNSAIPIDMESPAWPVEDIEWTLPESDWRKEKNEFIQNSRDGKNKTKQWMFREYSNEIKWKSN